MVLKNCMVKFFLGVNNLSFAPQTVNDVITGIIFYGIQLYLQAAGQGTRPAEVTALVLLNTRAMRTYQPIKDMTRPNTKAPWGNHFAFLHVPVPTRSDPEKDDPLNSIRRAKKIIKAKRNSLGVYLTAGILELIQKIKGTEACCTIRLRLSVCTNLIFSFIYLTGLESLIVLCDSCWHSGCC